MTNKEYRRDVTTRALLDSLAVANVACIVRMFMVKRFIIWPAAPVFLATFLYRQHDLFFFYNKKYFDMCNVGVQYKMGEDRNNVLQKCNELLGRIDF